MDVTLINYTPLAAETLIYTKNTRLSMSPGLFRDICAWPEEEKQKELAYIANTIPSSWEFVDYLFAVEGVSRAYTHQQVRTRAASYAQQTMRVLDMGEFEYVYTDKNQADHHAMLVIADVLAAIKKGYRTLIAMGQAPEDARGILPTNISTNIICKFNLRTLSELARSRTGGRTQSEYQRVINAMIDAVLAVHPWVEPFLFGDRGRDYFAELEEWAAANLPSLMDRAPLLKIIDKMRKAS